MHFSISYPVLWRISLYYLMLYQTVFEIILCAVAFAFHSCLASQNEFLERKGKLVSIDVHVVDSSLSTMTSEVLLVNDRHDTVLGKVRQPKMLTGKHPLAFLVVGIETGKEVVELIEGYDGIIVFGIDYPYEGVFDFSGWNGVKTAFALREMGERTVPQILLVLDWLSALPYVDTSAITLIAVSFGVFTALPAAAIDHRIDRLVVVQAGGDISTIVSANAERLGVFLPSWLAGWLAEMILSPFEPNNYIGDFAPRPLLLVSGESDRFFPRSSVESLYENANEPKEWIQHKSSHVMPTERALIKELTNIVARRLYGSYR